MRYTTHKQIRLPYYNYASSAYYFITICTKNRVPLFGSIVDGIVELSWIGEIVDRCWKYIPTSAPYAIIDASVIMPDHFHGIVYINNPEEKNSISEKAFKPQKRSLSIVIRNFKSAVVAQARKTDPAIVVWQNRFYDHIIRNEQSLQNIRNYIANNPKMLSKNHVDSMDRRSSSSQIVVADTSRRRKSSSQIVVADASPRLRRRRQ